MQLLSASCSWKHSITRNNPPQSTYSGLTKLLPGAKHEAVLVTETTNGAVILAAAAVDENILISLWNDTTIMKNSAVMIKLVLEFVKCGMFKANEVNKAENNHWHDKKHKMQTISPRSLNNDCSRSKEARGKSTTTLEVTLRNKDEHHRQVYGIPFSEFCSISHI